MSAAAVRIGKVRLQVKWPSRAGSGHEVKEKSASSCVAAEAQYHAICVLVLQSDAVVEITVHCRHLKSRQAAQQFHLLQQQGQCVASAPTILSATMAQCNGRRSKVCTGWDQRGVRHTQAARGFSASACLATHPNSLSCAVPSSHPRCDKLPAHLERELPLLHCLHLAADQLLALVQRHAHRAAQHLRHMCIGVHNRKACVPRGQAQHVLAVRLTPSAGLAPNALSELMPLFVQRLFCNLQACSFSCSPRALRPFSSNTPLPKLLCWSIPTPRTCVCASNSSPSRPHSTSTLLSPAEASQASTNWLGV